MVFNSWNHIIGHASNDDLRSKQISTRCQTDIVETNEENIQET